MASKKTTGRKMGRPNKILAAGKSDEVRALVAQGLNAREIAGKLSKKGFRIGHATVARFIAEDTSDRKAVARNVMAREAKESIPLATKALNGFVVLAMQGANDLRDFARASLANARELEDDEPAASGDAAENMVAAYRAMGDMLRAGTQAATSLAKITLGEESGDSAAAQALGDRIAGIVAARNKRGE